MNKNDYAGEAFNFYPYAPTVLSFPIQKNALIQQGLFKESEIAQIADTMVWNIAAEQGAIYRKDSVLINIIRNVAQNNWNRPVYFSTTVPTDSYLGLDSFLRTEGLALRVVPIQPSMNAPRDAFGDGIVHQTLMFENLKNFRYRGLTDASINFDDHIRNVIVSNYRNTFLRLCTGYSEQIVVWTKQLDWAKKGAADTLAAMGTTAPIVLAQNPEKIQQAQKTLAEIDAFVHKNIPYDVIRPNLNFLMMNAQAFYRADHSELAAKEFNELEKECIRKLTYYHQHRIPVDTRHPAYQGIGYAAQFYYESGNKPKAMELATTLEKLTGDGQLKQMLQNMDK
jgi:hypothetical protein